MQALAAVAKPVPRCFGSRGRRNTPTIPRCRWLASAFPRLGPARLAFCSRSPRSQRRLSVCQKLPLVGGGGLVAGSAVVDDGSALVCVVVEEESVVGVGSVVVVVVAPSGEGSLLAGAAGLVSVVEVLVVVEESVLGRGVAVEGSGLVGVLLAVLVESVPAIGGVEVAVGLEESLGLVELSALGSLELDKAASLVDVAGFEPASTAGPAELPVRAAVVAGTGAAPTLPSGVGVELGAAGDAAAVQALLTLGATRDGEIAGATWGWIATRETFRTG